MISIQTVMSREVITANPHTPIYEALDRLHKNKISGMPVLNNTGHVVGILTQKDVLKILIDKNLEVHKTGKIRNVLHPLYILR